MKLSIKQFIIVPLVIVNIMFLSVKLSFGLTIEALGNNLSTVISICVGGVIYLIATLALGGIDKEELLNAIEQGETGKIFDLYDDKDGEHVEVYIE